VSFLYLRRENFRKVFGPARQDKSGRGFVWFCLRVAVSFHRFVFQTQKLSIAVIAVSTGLNATERVPLGIIFKDSDRHMELAFTNAGSAAVRLSELRSSCACLHILDLPASVGPGQTALIPCVFRSATAGKINTSLMLISDEVSDPLETYQLRGYVADDEWLISSSELRAQPDAVIIDTRRSERYEEATLDGALNLPAYTIKTRTEWRGRPVVLVDEGIAPEILLEEVRKLQTQGFNKARVLSGGLAGWRRQGGKLRGPLATVPSRVAEITAAEAASAREAAPWQILQVTRAEEISDTLLTSAGGDGPLLVIAPEPAVYARVEARLNATSRHVYYLAGGPSAWAEQQAFHAALAARPVQSFQTHSATSNPVNSGGCGSCPK
jgi:rhodanese-related sulfurtransferase